jgi:hypothetical protein
MAYGSLKVDNIIFTNGGVDQTITVSGIVAATSGNLTVTGTISGAVVQGGTLVSGATVTGGTGQFTTLTGGTAGFTTVTGTTVTGTTANFVSGVFTTQISGATVTGTTANFASGVFTTQISGATVTGTTANFTSGNFTNISGGTHTITSGVFAAGSATNPSISFTSDPNTGIFSPGADQVAISTNGTGRLFVDASGNVEIAGTGKRIRGDFSNATHADRLSFQTNTVNGATTPFCLPNGTGTASSFVFSSASDPANAAFSQFGCFGGAVNETRIISSALGSGTILPLTFLVGTEHARIDTSGVLLVGTSTDFASTLFQVNGSVAAGRATADAFSNHISLTKTRSTSPNGFSIVSSGDEIGGVRYLAADGSAYVQAASIYAYVDGTPGANDMPGRLVFSTTADGAASPTERVRINNAGYSKFTNANTYVEGGGFAYHEFYRSGSGLGLVVTGADASYASTVNYIQCSRAASSAYSLLSAYSANGVDREFDLKGDGNGYCDGAWTGGGADYAEYFEWSDGNSDEQDRRGIAVVLDNDKIRPAVDGEDPIGVISGNPSVVGDAAWNKWSGKYLRDEYGTYIQEDYEVEDEDGNTVVQQRRRLNPTYDTNQEYISREQRPEWDCVGLMGKLRIRKGQPTGSRWIKMRDISDSVEEWLVR